MNIIVSFEDLFDACVALLQSTVKTTSRPFTHALHPRDFLI